MTLHLPHEDFESLQTMPKDVFERVLTGLMKRWITRAFWLGVFIGTVSGFALAVFV